MAETGHAKNVEQWAIMRSHCAGYGAQYDPTNPLIELAAMQTALTASEDSLEDVSEKLAPWKSEVAARENSYKGIRPLATQVANAVAASGAEQNIVDNIESLKKRIHGARVTALPPDDPGTPDDESQGGSVAHTSYVQIAQSFADMIQQLKEEPLYAPNEVHLQVATLEAKLTEMQNANAAVIAKATPLSNSRIARDEVLYADETGIFDRAALVKKYVKSVFGADSPQFDQINGLKFTRPR